jgi:hypothetical protein
MKKSILLLTISILILISIVAYFLFKPDTPKNILTETYHVTDKQYLTEDTTKGALSIDITVEYPLHFSDEKILNKIQSHIITNLVGEQYIKVPNDSILKQFVRELKAEYIHNNEIVADKLDKTGRLVLNNSFTMEGFALLNDEQIFTYGISRDVDFGGNHPTRTRFFYNYNLKTGELITEDAIFGSENYDKIAELLQQEVQRLSHNNDEMPTIDTFEESVYNKDAIRPNGNFYINDEAICYVFNPYEIAPLNYAYETEVRLPYPLIKTLLKENSVIQYLVQQHEAALSANNN